MRFCNRFWALRFSACLFSIAIAAAAGAQQKSSAASHDIAGMYTFLREGEFVQLTVEDGALSGYISRFGDADSDRGEFINQFFDKTTLDGNHLTFNTKTVHGVWYDFSGTVSSTAVRNPNEEGARVIRGKLVQHTTDANGNDKPMQRQVEFKSFPEEVGR